MEGTEEIILREPVYGVRSSTGERFVRSWVNHRGIWASRSETLGNVEVIDDTISAPVDVTFRFRRYAEIEGLNNAWTIKDWHGQTYQIQRRAIEGSMDSRGNFFIVGATRREGLTNA